MLNVQSNPHSQTHSHKLTGLDKFTQNTTRHVIKRPLQKDQTRGNLELSKRNQTFYQNLIKNDKTTKICTQKHKIDKR